MKAQMDQVTGRGFSMWKPVIAASACVVCVGVALVAGEAAGQERHVIAGMPYAIASGSTAVLPRPTIGVLARQHSEEGNRGTSTPGDRTAPLLPIVSPDFGWG
jgi:hypothetical protein